MKTSVHEPFAMSSTVQLALIMAQPDDTAPYFDSDRSVAGSNMFGTPRYPTSTLDGGRRPSGLVGASGIGGCGPAWLQSRSVRSDLPLSGIKLRSSSTLSSLSSSSSSYSS
jgi:hypothetical protein